MITEDLKALLRKQPFKPIRVHLTDGSCYEIASPEMALVTSQIVTIGFESEPGSGIADDVQHCRVDLIDHLDVLDTPQTAGT
jgi:hypothetical protein